MRLARRLDHASRLSTRWYVEKAAHRPNPITRKVELTMRRPGARIAPPTKVGTCRQTRREKTGAKGSSRVIMDVGRRSMAHLFSQE